MSEKGDKKSTGIVRKVDDLGRIVLPKELRTVLGIVERDLLEIFVDKDYIMLQKYNSDSPSCVFCGKISDILNFKGRHVCRDCTAELA